MLSVELGMEPGALDDLAYLNHAVHPDDNGRLWGPTTCDIPNSKIQTPIIPTYLMANFFAACR